MQTSEINFYRQNIVITNYFIAAKKYIFLAKMVLIDLLLAKNVAKTVYPVLGCYPADKQESRYANQLPNQRCPQLKQS